MSQKSTGAPGSLGAENDGAAGSGVSTPALLPPVVVSGVFTKAGVHGAAGASASLAVTTSPSKVFALIEGPSRLKLLLTPPAGTAVGPYGRGAIAGLPTTELAHTRLRQSRSVKT